MSVTIYVREEFSLVVSVHSGTTQYDEFVNAYTEMFRNPLFKPPMNLLVDLRRGILDSINFDFIQALVDSSVKNGKTTEVGSRIAVIVPDDISFGLSRMHATLSFDIWWEHAVFRTSEKALLWLKLPANLANDLLDDC